MHLSRPVLAAALALLTPPLTACDRTSPVAAQPSVAASRPSELTPALGPPGQLTGLTRLDGERPSPRTLSTTPSVAKACGDSVPLPGLTVGAAGELDDVVVWVESAGEPMTPLAAPVADGGDGATVRIDQERCAYVPAVLATRAGSSLQVGNSDPLLHNVRARAGGSPLFNVAMPVQGTTLQRLLPPKPGVVELRCDVHPWMRAWVRTFTHPYFTVSKAGGRFVLEGLPPGKHRLRAWHPRLPERSWEVEVKAGAQRTLELGFPAAELSLE